MKVIRTVHAHEAITFGDAAAGEDVIRVDRAGIVVANDAAERYEARATELGIETEVEDAPDGTHTGDAPLFVPDDAPEPVVPGAAVTGRVVGTVADEDDHTVDNTADATHTGDADETTED